VEAAGSSSWRFIVVINDVNHASRPTQAFSLLRRTTPAALSPVTGQCGIDPGAIRQRVGRAGPGH